MAMMKTNFESMQAIHYISKRLKKQVRNFGICGNKDKRGITTQRITLIRANPELVLRAISSKDWDSKVKLGSFERVWEAADLGRHKGN
jgi:tRNA pseudouridine13 synthase